MAAVRKGIGCDDIYWSSPLTARGAMDRLRREGWVERSGSEKQAIFTKPDCSPIVVPRHNGDIPKGTLRLICGAAGWEFPPHR